MVTPTAIADLELSQAAELCTPADGALHGEALAEANAAAREGRGPKPVAAGVQVSSLVGISAARAT
jgi:hypothetical protein